PVRNGRPAGSKLCAVAPPPPEAITVSVNPAGTLANISRRSSDSTHAFIPPHQTHPHAIQSPVSAVFRFRQYPFDRRGDRHLGSCPERGPQRDEKGHQGS